MPDRTTPQRTLSIGELASRTGLTPAVLRTWEARHGTSTRSGPRVGTAGTGRATWTSCSGSCTASARASASRPRSGRSRRPGARRRCRCSPCYVATTRTWLGTTAQADAVAGLSRAIEDDYLAYAEPGVVCASFQRERFYHSSRDRWSELARRSRWSMVFADFPDLREPEPEEPAQVPLSGEAPVRREWAVVAETSRLGVVLAGWETPGQDDVSDRHRTFEVVWTIDPARPAGAADLRRGCQRCWTSAGAGPVARARRAPGGRADRSDAGLRTVQPGDRIRRPRDHFVGS